ncbi:hypothetical protein E2562_038096 [Oryza meyeriana var. granulata]|uniref:Uncharacterized protein n=1 Tax=Oryza meyeriana var. granulata TaxID=110450 RepID=A0A6G1E8H8_9ORYZ|nr:hypothetical protein E2562_038096 [Oryza meyeriana var. granulata]
MASAGWEAEHRCGRRHRRLGEAGHRLGDQERNRHGAVLTGGVGASGQWRHVGSAWLRKKRVAAAISEVEKQMMDAHIYIYRGSSARLGRRRPAAHESRQGGAGLVARRRGSRSGRSAAASAQGRKGGGRWATSV